MLKSTGIVRKVDELGRVVIPIELRRTLNIAERDALEIYVDGEQIVLKKYEPACIFCGNAENVINYKGKNICKNCLEELKKTPLFFLLFFFWLYVNCDIGFWESVNNLL